MLTKLYMCLSVGTMNYFNDTNDPIVVVVLCFVWLSEMEIVMFDKVSVSGLWRHNSWEIPRQGLQFTTLHRVKLRGSTRTKYMSIWISYSLDFHCALWTLTKKIIELRLSLWWLSDAKSSLMSHRVSRESHSPMETTDKCFAIYSLVTSYSAVLSQQMPLVHNCLFYKFAICHQNLIFG